MGLRAAEEVHTGAEEGLHEVDLADLVCTVLQGEEAMDHQEEVCVGPRRQVGTAVDVVVDLRTVLPCKVRQWAEAFLLRDTITRTSTTKVHRRAINRHMEGVHRLARLVKCHSR